MSRPLRRADHFLHGNAALWVGWLFRIVALFIRPRCPWPRFRPAPRGGAVCKSVNFDFRAQNHEIMKKYAEIGA